MYNRKELKRSSRQLISQGKFKLLWKVAVYLLLILTIAQLINTLDGANTYIGNITNSANEFMEGAQDYLLNQDETALNELYNDYFKSITSYPNVSGFAILIAFVLSIMSSILTAGFEWWCLLNTRHQPNDFRNIFDGFNFPFKLIAMIFIRSLINFLGVFLMALPSLISLLSGFSISPFILLLIVPGVLCLILTFSYSQSYYILFENPELGVIESLRRSRKLMRGHKWQYFVLNLSFIGWIILGSLISTYIASMFLLLNLSILTVYSTIIFRIWLEPYIGFTTAGYYNYLTGYAPPETPLQEENV